MNMMMTADDRKKRNDELRKKAEKRLKDRGAPFFGAAEQDLLDLKIQVQTLIKSNNDTVKAVEELRKAIATLDEGVKESKLTVDALSDALISNKHITAQEVADLAYGKQLRSMGLLDKPDGMAGIGDTLLIKFRILHEGTVINENTANIMAYVLGTNGLPCDQDMIGMKTEEVKTFSFVNELKHPDLQPYLGKTVDFEVHLFGVKIKEK